MQKSRLLKRVEDLALQCSPPEWMQREGEANIPKQYSPLLATNNEPFNTCLEDV